MLAGPGRYFRLTLAFARLGLATELSFRANFLIKLLVEVLWLGILLVFYLTIVSAGTLTTTITGTTKVKKKPSGVAQPPTKIWRG